MSGSDNNMLHGAVPGEPDEVMLLAWVEGEALPVAGERAMADYLSARPEVAARLEAMRQDRLALRSMSAGPAPLGLIDRAMAAVHAAQTARERELLTGEALATIEPGGSGAAPKVRRRIRPGSTLRALLWDSSGRRILAVAAGLAITGVGVYVAALQVLGGPSKGSPATDSGRSIAQGGPLVGGRGATPIDALGGDTTPLDPIRPLPEPTTLASDQTEPATLSAAGETATLASARAGAEPAAAAERQPGIFTASLPDLLPEELAVAAGPDWPWELEGLFEQERLERERGVITPSWAIDLAQQRQLVVRVRAESDLAAIASHLSAVGASYAVIPQTPADLAQQLNPSAGGAVFLVRTRLDTAAISSLRRALEGKGEVVFEQAAGPLPEDASVTPMIAGAMLPPIRVVAGSGGWATVPIVVERR